MTTRSCVTYPAACCDGTGEGLERNARISTLDPALHPTVRYVEDAREHAEEENLERKRRQLEHLAYLDANEPASARVDDMVAEQIRRYWSDQGQQELEDKTWLTRVIWAEGCL